MLAILALGWQTGRSLGTHWLVRVAYLSSPKFVNDFVSKPTVDKVVLWPPNTLVHLHTGICTHVNMYILKKFTS